MCLPILPSIHVNILFTLDGAENTILCTMCWFVDGNIAAANTLTGQIQGEVHFVIFPDSSGFTFLAHAVTLIVVKSIIKRGKGLGKTKN